MQKLLAPPAAPAPVLHDGALPSEISSTASGGSDPGNTEYRHLADVPLRVEAVLDRIVMNIRAIAHLRPGSLVVSSRLAGDSVEIHVGGVPIATGEVVVIENMVAVRITDLSPAP